MLDAHRATRRRPIPVEAVPERSVEAPAPPDPALWRAVRRLPDKQRAAVTLRFAADLDYAAIGDVIDCSEAAARQNVRAGLAGVRREWDRMNTAELARRAAEEGLLDVAYTTVDAPFGRMLVAATPRGLVRTAFEAERADDVLHRARRAHLAAGARGARRAWTASAVSWTSTSRAACTEFQTPIDWRLSHGFLLRAREACAAIPYGAGAHLQGARRPPPAARRRSARRATPWRRNPIPIVVPCHRVLRTGGGLGGYGGGLECKRWLLDLESGTLRL